MVLGGSMDDNPRCSIHFWGRDHPFEFLSNFHPSKIVIEEKEYDTVEHYYQSQKFKDTPYEEIIRKAETPAKTKRLAKRYPIREDWDEVKDEVMLKGLRAKFTQNPELKDKLIETGECNIHEASPYDLYWGEKGLDKLGKLLMKVREE